MTIGKKFITGGDAIFTISGPVPASVTGEDTEHGHYTYRVQRVEKSERWAESYFVKLLTGPDNTSDYTYVGKLDTFTFQVNTTAKSKHYDGTYPLRLLNRVLARIACDDHAAYESKGFKVHHEGRCARCARLLTVPESIESGFGPECIKHV